MENCDYLIILVNTIFGFVRKDHLAYTYLRFQKDFFFLPQRMDMKHTSEYEKLILSPLTRKTRPKEGIRTYKIRKML